jgi:hypothetical protein
MQKIIPAFLLAFIFLCIASVLFESCKKTDSLVKSTLAEDKKLTFQFFNLSASVDPLVMRLANRIKSYNDATPFVSNFARNNGLPIWDKSIVTITNSSSSHRGGGGGTLQQADTVISVPLVLANDIQVNGSIVARIKGDSIFMKYVLAQDYKAYAFTGSPKGGTAKSFATYMFVLNRKVFGHQNFTITDERLFVPPTSERIDSTIRIVSFDTSQHDNIKIPATHCELFIISICGSNAARSTNLILPGNCYVFYDESCYTVFDDSEGWGSGGSGGVGTGGGTSGGTSGGTVPGGGGGGSTSPIPHHYPCSTPGVCNPPGGGIGWFPTVAIDDVFNPYVADSVTIDTSITNNFPCIQRVIDSLTEYANINAVAQVALKTVFGVNKKINLTIAASSNLPYNIDGETAPGTINTSDGTYSTTIQLNKWLLTHATQQYIAATIIHEAVHAYIGYCYNQYLIGNMDSSSFKNLFPLYWPPRVLYPGPNNTYYYQIGGSAQHKAMAASLINLLMQPLISLYPNPSIPAATRDSIYEAITWGGLGGTPSFAVRPDSLYIRAVNTMAKDTTLHRPFVLVGYPTQYNFDAHSLNLIPGCQ